MMIKKMNSNWGYSLVEVLIASALIMIGVLLFLQYQGMLFKTVKETKEYPAVVRAISAIQQSLIQESRFIPAFKVDRAFSESVTSTDANLLFTGAVVPHYLKCFDRSGVVLSLPAAPDTTQCGFLVTFVKINEPDRSMGSHPDLERIPLDRFWFKVQYKMGSQERTLYLSRLVTNVMYY